MWFRRRSFGYGYDTVPKWHLEAEHEGLQWTAACEYKYTFYYDSPLVSEEAPPKEECCRKCVSSMTLAEGGTAGFTPKRYTIRFPTLEEQSRGMLVVPRHKRISKEEPEDG